jgi:hypothetical protein
MSDSQISPTVGTPVANDPTAPVDSGTSAVVDTSNVSLPPVVEPADVPVTATPSGESDIVSGFDFKANAHVALLLVSPDYRNAYEAFINEAH